MKSLLDIYHENVGQKPLFSEIIDIDFYDGPTEALCQLMETEQWFICSLVYIEFKMGQRVFTLLEISKNSFLKFKSIFESRSADQEDFYQKLKEEVKAIYGNYSGRVFLFKSGWLNAEKYEVVELPLKELQYFNDVEQVLHQSEESKLNWINFFLPTK